MGVGQVIKREQRKSYISLVFNSVAKALATNLKSDIYFDVKQGNTNPEEFVKKLRLKPYDVYRGIKVGNINTVENSKSHLWELFALNNVKNGV